MVDSSVRGFLLTVWLAPTLVAAKLLLIILALLFTGAVATHALARAALQDGVKPVVAGEGGSLTAVDAAEAVKTINEITAMASGHQHRDMGGTTSKS